MRTISNVAKEKLAKGELSLGVGLSLARTVDIGRMMLASGYDWLFIDLEHGTMPLDIAAQISMAAYDAGITPIVRIPSGEFSAATRLLDSGVLGIVVPHVETAEEARIIVDRLKVPPEGSRSLVSARGQLDYASSGSGSSLRDASASFSRGRLSSPNTRRRLCR